MDESILALLIPIIGIVLGIGIAMLAIRLNYLRRKHIFELSHQQRIAAMEKELDLPALPEALLTDGGPSNPKQHLLKGLIWLFVGLGLGIATWATFAFNWSLFSLIPIGVGLAHLIYYAVEGNQEPQMPRIQNPVAVSRV